MEGLDFFRWDGKITFSSNYNNVFGREVVKTKFTTSFFVANLLTLANICFIILLGGINGTENFTC